MTDKDKKLWFKAKIYGWGWYPCSWQGWLVLLVWAVIFVFAIIKLDYEWVKNFLVILVITLILIYICYKKGEKPRWRWGK